MSNRRFTTSQIRALTWLVPGVVCEDTQGAMRITLQRLHLYHPNLVSRVVTLERDSTRRAYYWSLTDAGVAARAKLLQKKT